MYLLENLYELLNKLSNNEINNESEIIETQLLEYITNIPINSGQNANEQSNDGILLDNCEQLNLWNRVITDQLISSQKLTCRKLKEYILRKITILKE